VEGLRKEFAMKLGILGRLTAWMIVASAASGWAAGPQLQTLHSFAGGTDGRSPVGSLVADAAGNLYGTTLTGGSTSICLGAGNGCGIVFKLSPPKVRGGVWRETVLYRFTGGRRWCRTCVWVNLR
jgi:hypothetical protein